MQKLLKALLVSILLPTILLAQTEHPSTGAYNAGDRGTLALGVDSSGNYTPLNQSIIPGTGATNLGKAEDGAHTSGDVGVMGLGVVTTSQNCSFSTTNGDYVPLCISNGTGALHTVLRRSGWADDPVKAEDSGHSTSDAGVHIQSVRQNTLSASTDTDADYASIKSDSTGALWVQGGTASIYRSIDLDETEEDVNTSATRLAGWYIFNNTASVIFVKLYNATAANVTVGSTTPIMTIPIPANGGSNVGFDSPLLFATALTAAATTGVADADTGAPAANALIANIFYR